MGGRLVHMNFEDVIYCKDIKHLNDFISSYLEEKHLTGKEANQTMWALFYRWKEFWKI